MSLCSHSREILSHFGWNHQIKAKELLIDLNSCFVVLKNGELELSEEIKRLELDETLTRERRKEAFASIHTRLCAGLDLPTSKIFSSKNFLQGRPLAISRARSIKLRASNPDENKAVYFLPTSNIKIQNIVLNFNILCAGLDLPLALLCSKPTPARRGLRPAVQIHLQNAQ